MAGIIVQGGRDIAREQVAPESAGMLAEEAAVAAYDACLQSSDAADTHRTLLRMQEADAMLVHARPLCTVLRPRFLAASRFAALVEASETLAALFERVGGVLLSSDALLERIGAGEQEREIWSVDPGYRGFTLTSRLDSFLSGEIPAFVEYNAESPAGIAFADRLTEMFAALAPVKAWLQAEPPEAAGRRHLLDVLLWAYREWGGHGTPSVAVIDWENVLTRRDFELCAEYFRRQGLSVIIVDPRRIEYAHGRVSAGGTPINLVYRRVLLHELLERANEVGPLLAAYADGAVCMVNSPRSKLLHKKSVLALLSEGSLPIEMSARERAVVAQCVPWTRLVTEGETEYRGERVDLMRLLAAGQERFAVKPSDDYGGRGVILGWDCSADEWAQALERASGGGYVVQERVPVPQERYPVWQEGVVEQAPLWLDTNPLLFRGAVGSVLTRLSGSALLNVTSGAGSTAPTFIVSG